MTARRLEAMAERLGIAPPAVSTLRRYGLTRADWLGMLAAQNWQCPICERRVALWNVDHEHVPGWKRMPAIERRRFVRGVLCARCNWKLVGSNLPADTADRIAAYLRAYERRRDG